MKSAVSLALGLSLAANAALVTTFALRSNDSSAPATQGLFNSAPPGQTGSPTKASPKASFEPTNEVWSSLQASDPTTTVANLRNAGFPEQVVRAIAVALIDARYEQRQRQLLNPDQPLTPFWEVRGSLLRTDPETQAQMRELSREKQQNLIALLGELPLDDRARYYLRRRFGNLPTEKLTELMQIESDYNDLTAQVRQGASPFRTMPWDREQLDYIEQEKQADIAALLTPKELELHELYGSRSANSLRSKLGETSVTESEFRELFEFQKAFDETFDISRGIPSPDVMRTRRSAEEELNQRYRTILGDERFAEIQRNQNNDYRAASSVAEHFKLPAENAAAVYELAQDMEQRGRALQSNRELPSEQRDAQLRGLGREASARLDELLTTEGAQAYRESGAAARWLNLLEPRPPPRP